MTTLAEGAGARTPMGSDLAAGIETLALDQEITFTQYVRLVLPLDGYVFWVPASKITPSALFNRGAFNAFRLNQHATIATAAPTLKIMGSLHYVTDVRQEESESYAANRIIFTALDQVNDFNAIAPGTMWLGEFNGMRFGFSSQTSRYEQADLWHYVGFAVYADMETQIVDSLSGFDSTNVIISNSLPAWLALNAYQSIYGFAPPAGLTLFPSFLAPQNEPPPFGTVHIPPEATEALAMAPRLGAGMSHSQLCRDTVRITLWGARNFQAQDFVDAVYQYGNDTGVFGFMNSPVVRDEKRTQVELQAIAQKKSIEFEISYNQSRINDLARQVIKSATVGFLIDSAA